VTGGAGGALAPAWYHIEFLTDFVASFFITSDATNRTVGFPSISNRSGVPCDLSIRARHTFLFLGLRNNQEIKSLMETQTELKKALDKTKATRDKRDAIRRKWNRAITDADAPNIIENERALADIEAEVFADEVLLLKAKADDVEARREKANKERSHLENILKGINSTYAEKINEADLLRQQLQLCQAKLFGKDNEIEIAREDLNNLRDELKTLVATKTKGE
jgi:chromosome segregation ATPase